MAEVSYWLKYTQIIAAAVPNILDGAVDQWRKRLEACIRAEGGHFEQLLCDVDCLTFQLPHITTSFFSEPKTCGETQQYLQSDDKV